MSQQCEPKIWVDEAVCGNCGEVIHGKITVYEKWRELEPGEYKYPLLLFASTVRALRENSFCELCQTANELRFALRPEGANVASD